MSIRRALAFLLFLLPGAASAHHAMEGETPHTLMQGLLSGLAHPLIGIDHFLFLLVVALIARAGNRPLTVGAAFVLGTLGGAALHIAGLGVPWAELLIAMTLVGGGALLYSHRTLSLPAAIVSLGGAGLLHGYAYGESIVGAEASPLIAYLAGFTLVQWVVIAGLIALLSAISNRATALQQRLPRHAGLAACAAGLYFVVIAL